MKIKYITEDDLLAIKSNTSTIYRKLLVDGEKNIIEIMNNEALIKDTSYEVEDFELDMSQSKGKENLTDEENIQRVYNHMKSLSDSQASDERIWAAYTFSEFVDYMKYRWPATDVNDMKNHYLFNYSNQRSLFRNGISRLWWIGRITYDETRLDPYELTKFLCKDQDYIESICGRNVFNNPDIGMATLRALFDAEKAGKRIDRYVVREIGKYVNLLAGTYILDILKSEEIYAKVRKKLE